jgi:hypothetical protein
MTVAEKTQETGNEKTEKGSSIGSLTDLGVGFIDGAVARPYNATLGLILPKIDLTDSYDSRSAAAQIGHFGGAVADMVVLSKVTGGFVNRGLGAAAESGYISRSLASSNMFASTLSMGTTGALYNGVFTEGTLSERAKHATVGFATFATLGAATSGLSRSEFLGQAGSRTFMQNVKLGGLAGLPAGFVDAQANSLVNGKGLNTDIVDVGKTMGYYGLFGATMNGIAHGAQEYGPRTRMWLSDALASKGTRGEPAETLRSGGAFRPEAAEAVQPKKFNVPETGMLDLGKMISETPAADRIALLQEVFKTRSQVPLGSWMRLIEPAHMETFLRAGHELYPQTALRNAEYLIETRNLRPATADSQPINFEAWQTALKNVRAKLAPGTS